MLRRNFLRSGAAVAGGALLLGGGAAARVAAAARLTRRAAPIADAGAFPRFVNPLPRPARVDLTSGGTANLVMAQTTQDLIGGGLGLSTPVWGIGLHKALADGIEESVPVASPGPTLVARADTPVVLTWQNALPARHLLPVDVSRHWAFSDTGYTIAENGVPAIVHLHGGHTEARSDGHPEAWYTATGTVGSLYQGPRFTHENSQEAATLWYHDHTMGITRLNVYAGLAGFYLLRDERELAHIAANRLPSGPYEIELMVQDRTFRPDGRLAYPAADAQWPGQVGTHSQFFGEVVLVNGKAWPYLEVEPRQYRVRLLNGANSRFFRLSVNGRWPFPVWVIGGDGGFLERPQLLDRPLLIAPAERIDLVLDFREVAGGTFDVGNDAAAPFPHGPAVTSPTDRVMQFRVNQPYDRSVPEPTLPSALRESAYQVPGTPVRTRRLLLAQTIHEDGRAVPMLGTCERGVLGWSDPVTEAPGYGDTETWELYNATDQTHAVHLHLVQFEVLGEAPFEAEQDPETKALSRVSLGSFRRPNGAEAAPKDTVRVPPHHMLRLRAHFDRRGEYVWHCHLLEHEDHDMMRKFVVA
ncbi:multicopper oxidase family protein [Streptomyces hoynatensis]|uniref:Copper oxidase n=1 Tax=Streptomyces hoynatensis TaxID=1141874 RepID=A0A3A9YQA8_9ACTN|nr:multicopper oxidase domain-containing protein [Streptomyces hoynatensis]RKN37497.1 copper oxidase [Streptomyces hoynatensis]